MSALQTQIEQMLTETEAMLDATIGDRVKDVFVAAPFGKCPPKHLINEWLGVTGVTVKGELHTSVHRMTRDILLIDVPNFTGKLPEGWIPVDAPFFEGERTEHWAHRGLNSTYQAWLASR